MGTLHVSFMFTVFIEGFFDSSLVMFLVVVPGFCGRDPPILQVVF